MSKVDWPVILFMLMLCIAVLTCYYQQGETARARIEAENKQCDCDTEISNTVKTNKENNYEY